MIWSGPGIRLTLPDGLALQGMDALEQGGILIGRGQAVTTFTTPGPLDIRTPGLFVMIDDRHQRALDASGADYLGAWHSHPPGTPSDPSDEDLHDWRTAAPLMFEQQADVERLFFAIVTGDRLRVWAMDRALTLAELQQGGVP